MECYARKLSKHLEYYKENDEMSLLEKVQNKWKDIDITNSDALFKDTIDKVISKTAANIERFNNQFPYTGKGDKYILTDNTTWVSGYWTGWLWMIYNQTQDPKFKEAAEKHYEGYNHRFNTLAIHCHDVGVIYDMAAVRGYTVTGEDKWRNIGIRAAAFLSTRFEEKGQYLQAWGMPYSKEPEHNRTIIDSLCCIPLWFWAAEVLNDEYYKEIASLQADTIMKHLVRPDNSSGHTFFFDPETKEPLRIKTEQGSSNESTWSRGQGWGIQGFPVCYAYTGDKKYLDTAVKMLEWFVDELGDDIIPPWDFMKKEEEKDTSALTLAVNGMLRIAHFPDVSEEVKQACILMAKKAMTKLIVSYGTFDEEEVWGLIREGVYGKPFGNGINEFMIWGDYYFVENLMILAGKDYLEMEIYNKR
jgi:unsaturated chondroitin disaccharide hydrolase